MFELNQFIMMFSLNFFVVVVAMMFVVCNVAVQAKDEVHHQDHHDDHDGDNEDEPFYDCNKDEECGSNEKCMHKWDTIQKYAGQEDGSKRHLRRKLFGKSPKYFGHCDRATCIIGKNEEFNKYFFKNEGAQPSRGDCGLLEGVVKWAEYTW